MKQNISELAPTEIWSQFEKICAIPHPSKHEDKLIKFIKDIGEKYKLETNIDKVGNVIIRKPATFGNENLKTITLQSHLDMVPQKSDCSEHNFLIDPILPYIDGEWVTAHNTTLGADNGIGVAAIIAILISDDISHGPLEALFTVDEETGMTGAFNLEPNILKGEILLNLDSEEEGELYIGCAGGINTQASFPCQWSETPTEYEHYKLTLAGFKGGHSGVDIHLGHGNPNQEMARLLLELINKCNVLVSSINGGSLRNAIPRECTSTISVHNSHLELMKEITISFEKTLKSELANNGTELRLIIEKCLETPPNIDHLMVKSILKSVVSCCNGVLRMSSEMENVVEASSNIGIISTKDTAIEIATLQRASHNSLLILSAERVRHIFELAGAQVQHSGEYPGWKPMPNSPILQKMLKSYKKIFSKTPSVKVIHAGLECGIILSKYPNMEAISLGPTIRYPHSPNESVNIKSVEKFWRFLKEVLIQCPK